MYYAIEFHKVLQPDTITLLALHLSHETLIEPQILVKHMKTVELVTLTSLSLGTEREGK